MTGVAARLALGTVQFGLAYGATNQSGQVPCERARDILAVGFDAGVRVIDTAAAYGDAETVLGGLEEVATGMRIVTKTLPCPAGRALVEADIDAVDAAFARSRTRLGLSTIDTLLVHHGGNLLQEGGERLLDWLRAKQAIGAVRKIGVSVCDPDELFAILEKFCPQVVQLPYNLLDQRFVISGLVDRLARIGVEIHARSLFLQGTLLANPDTLLPHLAHLKPAVTAVGQAARDLGHSRLEICLRHGLFSPSLAALVVGVTSVAELHAILAAAEAVAERPRLDFRHLAVAEATVINPSCWPSL